MLKLNVKKKITSFSDRLANNYSLWKAFIGIPLVKAGFNWLFGKPEYKSRDSVRCASIKIEENKFAGSINTQNLIRDHNTQVEDIEEVEYILHPANSSNGQKYDEIELKKAEKKDLSSVYRTCSYLSPLVTAAGIYFAYKKGSIGKAIDFAQTFSSKLRIT